MPRNLNNADYVSLRIQRKVISHIYKAIEHEKLENGANNNDITTAIASLMLSIALNYCGSVRPDIRQKTFEAIMNKLCNAAQEPSTVEFIDPKFDPDSGSVVN